MEFDQLKSVYQSTPSTSLSQAEITRMLSAQHHPTLGRIRLRMLIQLAGIMTMLVVLYTGLDFNEKPAIAQWITLVGLASYAAHELIGLWWLSHPIVAETLSTSLTRFHKRLKTLTTTSVVITFVAGLSFYLGLAWGGSHTVARVVGILAFLGIMSLWNARIWKRRTRRIQESMLDLND